LVLHPVAEAGVLVGEVTSQLHMHFKGKEVGLLVFFVDHKNLIIFYQ
jgi:hypothetical protein